MSRTFATILLSIVGCIACVHAPPPVNQGATQAFFPCPAPRVFEAAIHVIEYDALYPIETKDAVRGLISTKEIRETSAAGPVKYRILATIRADESGSNLRIYRDLHRISNGRWIAVASDHELERRLLEKIRATPLLQCPN